MFHAAQKKEMAGIDASAVGPYSLAHNLPALQVRKELEAVQSSTAAA